MSQGSFQASKHTALGGEGCPHGESRPEDPSLCAQCLGVWLSLHGPLESLQALWLPWFPLSHPLSPACPVTFPGRPLGFLVVLHTSPWALRAL